MGLARYSGAKISSDVAVACDGTNYVLPPLAIWSLKARQQKVDDEGSLHYWLGPKTYVRSGRC